MTVLLLAGAVILGALAGFLIAGLRSGGVEEAAEPAPHFRLIAHRGYSGMAPENTLAAFAAAARAGYTCIETDVRFTSDGYAVLIHNDTVNATSDGAGSVSDLRLSDLRLLDFGSWYDAAYAGAAIPTLEEGLDLCRLLGLDMYLELKVPDMTDEQFQLVVDTVRGSGMRDHVTYCSFYLNCLRGAAERDPGAAFQLFTSARDMGGKVLDGDETILNAVEYLQTLLPAARRVSVGWNCETLTEKTADAVASAGLGLEAWTVDIYDQLLALPPACTAAVTNGITRDAIIAKYAGW